MTEKMIIITECRWCPHFHKIMDVLDRKIPYCAFNGPQIYRMIDYDGIPEWCPLPDSEDTK